MSEKEILARLKALELRLDALDGGSKEREPERAPASRQTFIKREENQFPKWVYKLEGGELKSALIEREEDMPEGAFESPDEALAGASDAPAPSEPEEPEEPAETEPEPTEVEIPEGWQDLHHSTRIKLAKSLPGGDDIVAADDADALIELELERRGDA